MTKDALIAEVAYWQDIRNTAEAWRGEAARHGDSEAADSYRVQGEAAQRNLDALRALLASCK